MDINYSQVKNKDTQVLILKKMLISAQLRSVKNPIDKALALMGVTGWSKRVITETIGITRTRLERAIEAKNEGRKIGQRGRPRYLKEEEEEKLVDIIKVKSEKRECMTRGEIREEVGLTLYFY